MHPIERLRMVARAGREDPGVLARESASALASFAGQPAALVTACRRLVDRQPACAPVWWVAARVLAATDPAREAWQAGDDLAEDPTAAVLAAALPDDTTVVVVGWPEQAGDALVRRGDTRVLAVDSMDEGGQLAGWLRRAGSDASVVPESGGAAAVATAGLVLLDAVALGEGGVVALAGSAAVAAVARQLGVPVWVVAGVGRLLPGPLWYALEERLADRAGPAWAQTEEVVPIGWIDAVAGPTGVLPVADTLARPTCPPAPELCRG
ncbi:MAG: hypothetical protein ACRD12_15325 [Acidimicrobiales bacterium]